MKTLRQLCAALLLPLMLPLSACAGEMQTGIDSPSPPSQLTTQGQIDTGLVSPPHTQQAAGQITTMVTASIDLITSVLSLI